MKPERIVVGVGVVLVALFAYAIHLANKQEMIRHELGAELSRQEDLVSTQRGLEGDLERTRKLREETVAEIELEGKEFAILKDTLESIRLKLKGAEKLGDAVDQLKSEYKSLLSDLQQYRSLTSHVDEYRRSRP